MQSTAVSALLEALSPDEREALLTDARLGTLPAAFAAVPDPRKRRGQRYDLPFLLTCLVAALLCNCNSLEAVGQWCALQRRHQAGQQKGQIVTLTPPFTGIGHGGKRGRQGA